MLDHHCHPCIPSTTVLGDSSFEKCTIGLVWISKSYASLSAKTHVLRKLLVFIFNLLHDYFTLYYIALFHVFIPLAYLGS